MEGPQGGADDIFCRRLYLVFGELFRGQVVRARSPRYVGVGVDTLYEGTGEGFQVLAAGESSELLALVGADAFVQAAQARGEGGGEVGVCGAYGHGLEELFRGYGGLAFEWLGLGLVAFEDADGVDEDEVGLGLGVGGDGVEGGLVYDAGAAALHLLQVVGALDVAHEEEAFEGLDVGAGGDHVHRDGDPGVEGGAEFL